MSKPHTEIKYINKNILPLIIIKLTKLWTIFISLPEGDSYKRKRNI